MVQSSLQVVRLQAQLEEFAPITKAEPMFGCNLLPSTVCLQGPSAGQVGQQAHAAVMGVTTGQGDWGAV